MSKDTMTAEHFDFAVDLIRRVGRRELNLTTHGDIVDARRLDNIYDVSGRSKNLGNLADLKDTLGYIGPIAYLKAQLDAGGYHDKRLLLIRLFAYACNIPSMAVEIPDDHSVVSSILDRFYDAYPGTRTDFTIQQLGLQLGSHDLLWNYCLAFDEGWVLDWLQDCYRQLHPEHITTIRT